MASNGESSEGGAIGPAPLIATGRLLAERGAYGLVWFDDALVTTATYGRLVDFVEIGEAVTDSLYALVGLESEIASLRKRSGEILDLPEITLVTRDGRKPRSNISVFWSEEDQSFVAVVARTGARSDLEIDLARQMRARLMAEAEVQAKSRALEKANTELARANADLEAFASIISHDLQSPMRALRYMVDELEEALAGGDAQGAAGTIEKVRLQSRRMTGMLRALHEYSSVTRKAEAIESVDTRALIEAIVSSMPVPEGFMIEIEGRWPTIDTLAAPLDLVLRNLIDNALKHHDRTVGRVRLSANERSGFVTFRVADDGPGIRPEHQEAVFQPFRRILTDREVAGEGMGLALVKRTVEGAEGTIGIESQAPEHRGTVFTIEWPTFSQDGAAE